MTLFRPPSTFSPIFVAMLALSASCGGGGSVGVAFTDVTAESGVSGVQRSTLTSLRQEVYFSGGVAVADYDNDGWPDLFVTRVDAEDRLYRNLGDGSFTDTQPTSGIEGVPSSNGAAWADIDNDGDRDLIVSTLDTRCHLFVNDGGGGFTEDALARNADVTGPDFMPDVPVNVEELLPLMSIAPGDVNNDGWIDLHTTEWQGAWSRDGNASRSRLLQNRGAAAPGFFDDVTTLAGVEFFGDMNPDVAGPTEVFAFTSRIADFDNDGWSDLAVVGDFETSRLFWNNGDGTFENGTSAAGVATDENGMGTAVGDIDNDGDLDWFVTSIFDPRPTCAPPNDCTWGVTGNRLFRNDGNRRFTDITEEAGVRDGGWGWGAGFADFDNDGDLDLVMANGQAFPGEDSYFERDRLRLFLNDGTGTFADVAVDAGLTDAQSAKGLATFDYDRDGDLDLFITNNGASPVLYRNDSPADNAWLRLKLVGTASNRDAFGARVSVEATSATPSQLREVSGGSHYLSQSELVVHIGLGALGTGETVNVTVSWPATGRSMALTDLAPNQTLVVTEPPG